jgi:CRP-like cAMP-binding protein
MDISSKTQPFSGQPGHQPPGAGTAPWKTAAVGEKLQVGATSQCVTVQRAGEGSIVVSLVPAVDHRDSPMSEPVHDPQQNRLLAALSPDERQRLYPHLQLVPMPLGKVLYESGDVLRHVYFPTDSIVSLLYVLADGASAEISVVGNEGMIGIALFMGGETTPSRAIVQSSGFAYRLIGQQLKDEFHRSGEMQLLLLRYTQALITQMAQTAVCNRHHSVDQQLCRWLLLSLDRLTTNELVMTQELIANMLGVRREGVTEAAGKLDKLGVIRYARGRITVLDRPMLEQLCCECYAVVKKESDRLLPPRAATEPAPIGTS